MNRQPNWDDLSRTIRDEVDRAVNSQDFQNMARNVRHVVEAAANVSGEAIRRAAQTVRQGSQTTQIRVADLYGKTGAKVVGGLAKTVLGGTFTLACAIVMLVMACTGLLSGTAISAMLLLPSVLLLKGGNGIPDQYQDMAVETATLIICDKAQFFQHLLFDSNGYTFDSHKHTSIQIYCVFIIILLCVIMSEVDIPYI